MSYDKQCSSCGGFCGRGGCKRENVKSPARKPLTDEEIQEMRYSLDFPCNKHPFINIVKAVERAHGIRGWE